MLTKSLEISDTTKINLFQLILFQSDHKILQKYCRDDLSSFVDRL